MPDTARDRLLRKINDHAPWCELEHDYCTCQVSMWFDRFMEQQDDLAEAAGLDKSSYGAHQKAWNAGFDAGSEAGQQIAEKLATEFQARVNHRHEMRNCTACLTWALAADMARRSFTGPRGTVIHRSRGDAPA